MPFVCWSIDNSWQQQRKHHTDCHRMFSHHFCIVLVTLLSLHMVETTNAQHALVQKPVYPPLPHTNFKDTCLLGSAEQYIEVWCNANGTLKIPTEAADQYLDLSHAEHTPESLAESVAARFAIIAGRTDVKVMSVAYATLRLVPAAALAVVNASLEQLTMRGNYFHTINADNRFPILLRLLELDLCDCRIVNLDDKSFASMPNLERLLLAGNRIHRLTSQTFAVLPHLQHLDMAYNYYTSRPSMINENVHNNDNADDSDDDAEVIALDLPPDVFQLLNNLTFLDMSFTQLLPSSARIVIGRLPSCVEMLSICYTAAPDLLPGAFDVMKPWMMDLSGNPLLAFHLEYNTMEDLASSLEVLALDDVGLQSLEFFCVMPKLQVLQLAGNNINALYDEAFTNLVALRVLDLSANHLGNWYEPVLTFTPRLRILKVHDNNINLITNEMLQDFKQLDYVALGNNMFICSCMLRDFVDMAMGNDPGADSTFRLMDFDEWRYSCVNTSTSEVSGIGEIANCVKEVILWNEDGQLTPLSIGLIAAVLLLTIGTVAAIVVAYKYWQCVQAAWLNVRNGAFLRRSRRGQTTKLIDGQNRKNWPADKLGADGLTRKDANNTGENEISAAYKYDVFVSYCEQDRDWILTEFLPNMDQCNDIKVCLHERDFLVGLSILDNIMHCMEESRCLLLVVSENFLQSQWCQFEMSLAQHRLIEAHQDQLILIMLEDIPLQNRPQTLQYMMRTKTYIEWPTAANRKSPSIASSLENEQMHFFRRLKNALKPINIRNEKVAA